MCKEDAMLVARLVMEHGGAVRSEEWYEATKKNATETREVEVPNPPMLRIIP